MWVLLRPPDAEEPSQQTFTTIGLDIAKWVFQLHSVDAEGDIVLRQQLKGRRYVLAPSRPAFGRSTSPTKGPQGGRYCGAVSASRHRVLARLARDLVAALRAAGAEELREVVRAGMRIRNAPAQPHVAPQLGQCGAASGRDGESFGNVLNSNLMLDFSTGARKRDYARVISR